MQDEMQGPFTPLPEDVVVAICYSLGTHEWADNPLMLAELAGRLTALQLAHTLREVKARVDILAEDKHATSPSMVALQDWLAESMHELGIEPEETA